ncbi:MAG TPA: AraC family transcriptional regulator [Chitinophagaceae bacterium]|nr:AraC family transcriptional regulator [Chitinophagaceae bacterium]
MQLYIKNMVCDRCIAAITKLLDDLKLPFTGLQLGEVILLKTPSVDQMKNLEIRLNGLGFEILGNEITRIIEKIKTVIIKYVHYGIGDKKYKFSNLLASKVHKDYSYLSKLFSETEGITIEKYMINQKIEKVKELIVYDELNLTDIAYQLGYSSVAHLSSQFKKTTGLSPTHFKKIPGNRRKALDSL